MQRRVFFVLPLGWIIPQPDVVMAATDSNKSAESNMVDPKQVLFKDDGRIPNSKLPVLIYPKAIGDGKLEGDSLATMIETQFDLHDWRGSWRGRVFEYHHYHSITHEVLGVYRGSATLQLGGEKGQTFELSAGDVVVLPAGTGHKRIKSSADFGVVGAYPEGQSWDLLKGEPGERPEADKNIAAVKLPAQDPVQGKDGALLKLWKQ